MLDGDLLLVNEDLMGGEVMERLLGVGEFLGLRSAE